ncbi:MAG: SAM-dependent methyltransferase [Spirochaetia bacterium]
MSSKTNDPVAVSREYYNSSDADNFYYTIWGGEDIHIGLYQNPDQPIREASRSTVQRMAERLSGLGKDKKVLDIGAGYGGAARYLAKTYGTRVTALNLSEVENRRDREMNREQELDHLIDVVDGSFEDLPFEDESFDYVWSQDAILHSGNREKVLEEAVRVLKPGGELVFTDPMMADDCPAEGLKPILDRIHLENLACPSFYRNTLRELGCEELSFEEHTDQLTLHYSRVLAETEWQEEEIRAAVSDEYIENMKKGLRHWVEGGENGRLAWGIFRFKKK